MAKKLTAARIKKLSANPGERSRLPDSALSPALLAKRRLNERLNQTVAPGLTYRDVARQANTDTDLQFGEQQRHLETLRPRIADWYTQYKQAIADGAARQKAITDAAVAQVGQLQQGVSGGNIAPQMQADAASRGATVDPVLAQQAQNAGSVRNVLSGSFGAQLVNQGAAAQTDFVNQGTAALQQGGEADTRLEGALRELLGKKGAFNVSRRSEIVGDASKNALQNALTQSTIGDRAADNKREDLKTRRAGRQWATEEYGKTGVTKGAWRDWGNSPAGRAKRAAAIKAAEKKSGKAKSESSQAADDFYRKYGVKPQSTSAISSARTKLDEARIWAKKYKAQNVPKATTLRTLIEGVPGDTLLDQPKVPKFDSDWARAAIEEIYGGKISKSTAHRLHKSGYTVKSLGLK